MGIGCFHYILWFVLCHQKICIDCVFVAQIYLNWDNELSLIEKWVLFSVGALFVILPLIFNLIQLHKEIKVWVRDIYSKHTVQAWTRSYLRLLYAITILSGSAFTAVDICNSNIFHLQMFNMGLNKRQRAIFKNQRILSTVLCENIPQLILQIIYLILTSESSISPITIIAMIFSLLSIVLSVFNYKLSSLLIECEAITVIEINVESKQLANTRPRRFRKMIVHHRKPICRELSKIIFVDKRLIEILMPIQTTTGCKLTVYIRNDSSDTKLSSKIVNTLRNAIISGELAKVTLTSLCFVIYFVKTIQVLLLYGLND